jgi:hypothetical protein
MSRTVTLLGYAVLLAVAVALEAGARRRPHGPTAGRALRLLLGPPALHVLALAAWLWLGWHLFARVHHG